MKNSKPSNRVAHKSLAWVYIEMSRTWRREFKSIIRRRCSQFHWFGSWNVSFFQKGCLFFIVSFKEFTSQREFMTFYSSSISAFKKRSKKCILLGALNLRKSFFWILQHMPITRSIYCGAHDVVHMMTCCLGPWFSELGQSDLLPYAYE